MTNSINKSSQHKSSALIRVCNVCENVNAINLDASSKNEQDMQEAHHTVKLVTREEAKESWKIAGQCDHTTLIKSLRSQLAEKNSNTTNNIIFFLKGEFSQWYGGYKNHNDIGGFICDAYELAKYTDNVTQYIRNFAKIEENYELRFNCCEQAMMFIKAIHFSDFETAKKIMQTENPREQKNLGRQVKDFVAEKWDRIKLKVVITINEYKFSQNPTLKKMLIDSYPLILAEANPVDPVWGIGLAENDEAASDIKLWKGENLLGVALMSVRDKLVVSNYCGISLRFI